MELKEAVKRTIMACYRESIDKNDGYVFVEVGNYDLSVIEVVMLEATNAITYLENWEQGIYDFGGINFTPSGTRVQYIRK